MNYSFELREEATREFADAYVWYEEQQEGLGLLFKRSVDDKLKQICSNPLHYKAAYKRFHQSLTDKFSFLIVYTINEKNKLITVFAIFHTSRNPRKKFRKNRK